MKYKILQELADTETSDEVVEQPKDVGAVAQQQGFKKSKKEMFAFGSNRPVTLLSKVEKLGGLTLNLQYVINPKTGAWSLRANLVGQDDNDMVEFDKGEDPSSLIANLEKKTKITPHQAIEYLNPPSKSSKKKDEVTESKKSIDDEIADLEKRIADHRKKMTDFKPTSGRHIHAPEFTPAQISKALEPKLRKLEALKRQKRSDAKKKVTESAPRISPNAYFQVKHSFNVWVFGKHVPTNHYYGSARIHKPSFTEGKAVAGDELHWLHGGLYLVSRTDKSVGRMISLSKPNDDISSKHDSYYLEHKIVEMVEDEDLKSISATEASKPKYVQKPEEVTEAVSAGDYFYHGSQKEHLAAIKTNGLNSGSDITTHENIAAYYAGGGADGRERGLGIVLRIPAEYVKDPIPHPKRASEGQYKTTHIIQPDHLQLGMGRGKNGSFAAKSWKKLK